MPCPNRSPILSSMTGDPDMVELIGGFVNHLKDRVRSLEVAYAANDLEGLARLAHQLKGSSGGFGFHTIGQMAAALEQSARNADSVTDVAEELEGLISMCRRAMETRSPQA